MDEGDMLAEILLRLPAKSLIRFKSVSKKWHSLISSDHFCHQHTLRPPKLQQSLILQAHIPPLLYFNPTINGGNATTPYTLTVPHHHIIQSCNGLMLLKSSTNCPKNSYYVYNPTTRQSRKITFPNNMFPCIVGLTLAFDPSKSPHYKIVCIRSTLDTDYYHCISTDDLPFQIEVYDSESQSWKKGPKPSRLRLIQPNGVHCNGFTYWHHEWRYFDMAADETVPFWGPQTPHCNHGCYSMSVESHLQESNGKMFYFELIECGIGPVYIAVWELGMEEGKPCDWLLDYYNVLTDSPTATPNAAARSSRSRILRFMDTERDSLLIYQAGKIRVYSFISEECEDLFDITSQPFYQPHDDMFHLTAFQFGESLALV